MPIHSDVKKLRNKLNLSQKKLAVRLRVSQSTVSQWERNGRQPNLKILKKLQKISDKYGLKLKWR